MHERERDGFSSRALALHDLTPGGMLRPGRPRGGVWVGVPEIDRPISKIRRHYGEYLTEYE